MTTPPTTEFTANAMLLCGDALHRLQELEDNSVHAVVCDPPYGLGKEPDALKMLADWVAVGHHDHKPKSGGFMGATWDAFVPQPALWKEVFRVLKPGGHCAVFAGTRTVDLMGLGLRIAGFEMRDSLHYNHNGEGHLLAGWTCSQGFPKAPELSKMINSTRLEEAHELGEALATLVGFDMMSACSPSENGAVIVPDISSPTPATPSGPTSNGITAAASAGTPTSRPLPRRKAAGTSETAKPAESPSQKSPEGTGIRTPKSGIAAGRALGSEPEKTTELLHAVIAESLSKYDRTAPATGSATGLVSLPTSVRLAFVSTAELNSGGSGAPAWTSERIAAGIAQTWLCESTSHRAKADAVLKIWRGKKQCTPAEITRVLCAEVVNGLKHTMLNQSPSFQNCDTSLKTACASAMTVITTKSTMAHLLSSMVATLKRFAADEVVANTRGPGVRNPNSRENCGKGNSLYEPGTVGKTAFITEPSSPEAKKWNGWAGALKPCIEPILIVRKPLDGTVVNTLLTHGAGAMNIDACRVPFASEADREESVAQNAHGDFGSEANTNNVYGKGWPERKNYEPTGRFPGNFMHDGSPEVCAALPGTAPSPKVAKRGSTKNGKANGNRTGETQSYPAPGDSGTAARFFNAFPFTDEERELCALLSRIHYCPKTAGSEKDEGLGHLPVQTVAVSNGAQARGADYDKGQGIGLNKPKERRNTHPTVKPQALMRWLVRLVTPVDGVCLDPFAGSGSTGVACAAEGRAFVGVELQPEYFNIALHRILHAEKKAGIQA